jgi:hypothetical protein
MEYRLGSQVQSFHRLLGKQCVKSEQAELFHMLIWQIVQVQRRQFGQPEAPVQKTQSC